MASLMSRGRILCIALPTLLALRTGYGLVAEFWFPDEKQIYLLGLKYCTTGQWPYLGPDVVYTNSQIPGALQALMVGLPLRLTGLPEAPALLLNLLSFGALALLAWYASRRFPGIPAWFTWGWILTCPWALVYGTRVVNPSYVLPFAVLFFVGAYEALGIFERRILPAWLALFLQGVATTSIMQLHLSWVLLPPVTLLSLQRLWREDRCAAARGAGACAGGLLLGAATLLPTFLWWGAAGGGGVGRNLAWSPGNLGQIGTVAVRFLGFASFEVPYMIGSSFQTRLAFMKDHPWVVPFALLLLVAGGFQIAWYGWSLFRRGSPEWRRARNFTVGVMALVWLSFSMSVKGPSSHTFYLVFPVALLYSFFCVERLLASRPRFAAAFGALLFCGLLFHAALAIDNYEKRSMYRNRALVVRAIEERDYRVLGLRRADEWGYGY
jgi:hypothetical protein